MATLILANTFVALTTAESAKVNENFGDVVSFLNTQVAHLDGSQAFSGIPSGPATDPTTANQFSRKAYVDARSSNADNLASGTVAVARGGTGRNSVTAGTYLKGAGTGALAEVSAATVVGEGLGVKAADLGRRLYYGLATLTWAGGSDSVDMDIDVSGFNAITLTPVGNQFTPYVVSWDSSSVKVRGAKFGGYTGTHQVFYMMVGSI